MKKACRNGAREVFGAAFVRRLGQPRAGRRRSLLATQTCERLDGLVAPHPHNPEFGRDLLQGLAYRLIVRVLGQRLGVLKPDERHIHIVRLQPDERLAERLLEVLDRQPCERIGRTDLPQHEIGLDERHFHLDARARIAREFTRDTAMDDLDLQALESLLEELLDEVVIAARGGITPHDR